MCSDIAGWVGGRVLVCYDDLTGPRCKWWAPLSTPLPHTLHTASRLIVTVPRLSRYQTAKPLLVLLQQQMMQVTVATTATVNICKLLASTGFLQNTSGGFPRLSTTFCGVLSMISPGPCMASTSTSFFNTVNATFAAHSTQLWNTGWTCQTTSVESFADQLPSASPLPWTVQTGTKNVFIWLCLQGLVTFCF